MPPCRLTPVGRRGSNRPPGRCRRGAPAYRRAVPPPVRTARPLTGCADPCGRCAPRRRAALSPWGGTAPDRPSAVEDRPETAVPPYPCVAARPRTGRLPRCGWIGRKTAVSSLPLWGRRGARLAVPSPVGRAAWTAVSPLEGGEGRHGLSCRAAIRPVGGAARTAVPSLPVGGTACSAAPALAAGAGRGRVALRWGRRATRRRQSCRSYTAERRGVGPPCRPPCTRGRHGARRNDAHPAGFPKRLPSGDAERLR